MAIRGRIHSDSRENPWRFARESMAILQGIHKDFPEMPGEYGSGMHLQGVRTRVLSTAKRSLSVLALGGRKNPVRAER